MLTFPDAVDRIVTSGVGVTKEEVAGRFGIVPTYLSRLLARGEPPQSAGEGWPSVLASLADDAADRHGAAADRLRSLADELRAG